MEIKLLELPGTALLLPETFADERGTFCETYSHKTFAAVCGAINFVQDNQALSHHKGTIRGLHFQIAPMAQAKLIRVLRGAIFDVIVDLRRRSETYGQHLSVHLSAQNRAQLFIPAGFAHGYCTLEPATEVFYKVDQLFSPGDERGLAWDDPELAINWPDCGDFILSDKDKKQSALAQLPDCFP